MIDEDRLRTIFTQLLVQQHIAPARNFPEETNLFYYQAPDIEIRARIRYLLGQRVQFLKAQQIDVENLLKYWRAQLIPQLEQGSDVFDIDPDSEYLEDMASEAPVIRMVNHLMERALDLNASDIHFEPEEHALMVRCRVDGVMIKLEQLPHKVIAAISSRIKLMARLDIGEKRLPQDGRIQYRLAQRNLDMRISTLPGVHGESIVLRILDRSDVNVELDQLGMPPDVLIKYNTLINQPFGMVLVTGPTGSGKTTSLYGTLEKIRTGTQKIITIEDPVEYQMEGVTQIHVNAKIGLTFSSGLRSIVRQDPDVILVGEIRDSETANIAIESALTGHLVFSTLHTNDAASAVTRLQDMGIDTYLISSSVLGVMAQRLVRRVCEHCAKPYQLSQDELHKLDIEAADYTHTRKGSGCEHCGQTGYRGRVGIYELLILSDSIRHVVAEGGDANNIRQQAQAEAMRTLHEDALEKLAQGITTSEEVFRVTRAN